MAKGIRSKWKIKMRNIKREKNAPKELERLKKAVANVSVDKLSDESSSLINYCFKGGFIILCKFQSFACKHRVQLPTLVSSFLFI